MRSELVLPVCTILSRADRCCRSCAPGVHLSDLTSRVVASIVTKRLSTGKAAYLVRYRSADGVQRGKQFDRRRDAERYASLLEIELGQGTWVDPRLGRITVGEWFERWWPTVNRLRATTRARDEASFRTHVLPTFATT